MTLHTMECFEHACPGCDAQIATLRARIAELEKAGTFREGVEAAAKMVKSDFCHVYGGITGANKILALSPAPTAPQGEKEDVIRFTVAPDPLTGEPMYTRVEPIPVPSGPREGGVRDMTNWGHVPSCPLPEFGSRCTCTQPPPPLAPKCGRCLGVGTVGSYEMTGVWIERPCPSCGGSGKDELLAKVQRGHGP
jgi:hypothetical protein